MPKVAALGGLDAVRHQVAADLVGTLAHQIAGKDPADDGGLVRVNLRQAVRPLAVAEEAGVVVVYLAVLEVLPVAPLDAAAEGLAFRLSLAHHKGEDHLVVPVHLFRPSQVRISRLELEATERRYYLRLSGYIAGGGFVICY